MKTLKRIPNRRDQDYFNLYDNPQFQQIAWYQQVFNFISRFEFSPYSASSRRMQANSSDSVIFLTVVLFPSYSSSALQEQYHPSIAFA